MTIHNTFMHAACIQMDIRTCQKDENTLRALAMACQAIDAGAELLVFPELFLTGFCYDMPPEAGLLPALDPFRRLREDSGSIIIGSIMAEYSGGMVNAGFCLDREWVGFYHKAHLFGREKEHFVGGSRIEPVLTSIGSIGLEICYDIRFPEVSRRLSALGADILVTIGQFPAERIAQWRALAIARAIENQIHHLACNAAGPAAGGGSLIVDPWGRILREAGTGEEILLAGIDLIERERARQSLTCWEDRRPELY